MQFADRQRYYNRCKPLEALAPNDDRNVEIDAICIDGERPRGAVWVDRIANHFLLADGPLCRFVTGLPGSGKSTDLLRLAEHLRQDHTCKLLPIIAKAEDLLDLDAPIDVPDLMLAVVQATEAEVSRVCGPAPSATGAMERLWKWLSSTDVELQKLEASVGVAKVVAELRRRDDLRARLRNNVSLRVRAFIAEVRERLTELEARARDSGFAGLLVIVDSLEKLRGISTNWLQVLDSAERTFVAQAEDLVLPVHVVYTVPLALIWRMRQDVDVMPMIKLYGRDAPRDGAMHGAGLEAALQIVRRRIPEDGLRQLFGDEWLMSVTRLIRLSGGYPRDLVHLLQMAVHAVQDAPLDERDVDRVCNEFSDQLQRMVLADDLPIVARVAAERAVRPQEGQLHTLDRLVRAQVILAYHNDRPWFDVHPAARELLATSDDARTP
ncbi:MAG: hypothetical protein H6747_13770 [Deltaproteobacteria bacterium]|nr:hypothetical protein [Deltaproteobacteria bacterium]